MGKDRLYSAIREARVPFVDAEDIAAFAAVPLLTPERASGDVVLIGPAALTYD